MPRRLALAILLLALSGCERGGPAVAAIPRDQARAAFLEHCALCHGARGDGRGPRRRSLFVKPPDFRRQTWRRGKTAAEIRTVIRDGRPGSDMPAWKSLDDATVAGLADYVLGLADAGDAARD